MSCHRYVCGFTPFSPSFSRQTPVRLAGSKAELSETQKKKKGRATFRGLAALPPFLCPDPYPNWLDATPSAHLVLLTLGFLLLVTANSLQTQECTCGLPREPEAPSFNMLSPPQSQPSLACLCPSIF